MRSLLWAFYQAATGVALLVAGPVLLARRGGHYLPTIPGRLGGGGKEAGDGGRPPGGPPLWIHAVSVGEVAVAATLARALPPEVPLLVTTITPTGQARARALLGGSAAGGGTGRGVAPARRAAVAYLPFDLGFAVGRFFRRFGPGALVLVEGDFWPLVLREAERRGLPVAVVNGRVSDRSFARLRRLRPLLGPLFGRIDRFGVQTPEDRERLLALGVPAGRVEVTGNLKFDSPPPERRPALEAAVGRLAAGRPVLVAGSTMAGEEEQVLEAFARLGGGARALLVLAPRHPERWDGVERLLAEREFAAVRRSALGFPAAVAEPAPVVEQESHPDRVPPPWEGEGWGRGEDRRGAGPDQAAAVLLLDTIGELAGLYAVAAAAFVGGTLVPTGGHNPLEPARFGVPVAVGPSMENFRDMAERFDRSGAWRRVAGADELAAAWREWLDDPAAARAQGARASRLAEENRGALERTLALLAPVLAAVRGPGPAAGAALPERQTVEARG